MIVFTRYTEEHLFTKSVYSLIHHIKELYYLLDEQNKHISFLEKELANQKRARIEEQKRKINTRNNAKVLGIKCIGVKE